MLVYFKSTVLRSITYVLYAPGACYGFSIWSLLLTQWQHVHPRLGQVDAPGAKEDDKKSEKPQASEDWWTGSDYKGRQYTTLDAGDGVSEADVFRNKATNVQAHPLVVYFPCGQL